jgi:hypothetical protein
MKGDASSFVAVGSIAKFGRIIAVSYGDARTQAITEPPGNRWCTTATPS